MKKIILKDTYIEDLDKLQNELKVQGYLIKSIISKNDDKKITIIHLDDSETKTLPDINPENYKKPEPINPDDLRRLIEYAKSQNWI